MKVKVILLPMGREVYLRKGVNLRAGLIELGIPIDSPCGGQGTCLKCKVQISGVHQGCTELEQEKLSPEELRNGWRLACQVTAEEPGKIHLPETDVLWKALAFNPLGEQISLQPNVRRRNFHINEPAISDQRGDWDRLAEDLEIGETVPLFIDLPLLREFSGRLREWNFQGEAILAGNNVVALEPPNSRLDILGVAIDIGTTTLAGGLVDLETGTVVALDVSLNPQIVFGADVISRISYIQENPERRKTLQKKLIRALNQLLLRMCRIAKKKRERIFEATVVGNTTMLHLLLGLDPVHIALSPYVGVLNRSLSLRANELGLHIHPLGKVHALPSVASFIGADTVAMILATKLHQTSVPKLAIDIGTNAEIILSTGSGMLAASAAAGPAFEGGRIKFGMRATKGAISMFHATPSPKYAVIGNSIPQGICGSGLIDLVSELFRVGVLDPTGRLLLAQETSSPINPDLAQCVRIRGAEREFVVYTDKTREITLTQRDIRELQLAKGAIRAAIEILMKEANINISDITEIFLAGVFGNYIDPEKAHTIGLIPPFPKERIHFIGCGALNGCLKALINLDERQQANDIARQVSHIELSSRADFQDTFVRYLKLGRKYGVRAQHSTN